MNFGISVIFRGRHHAYSIIGSGVTISRLRDTETISKQTLQMAENMHGRRVLIYRRIWCMLEFAKVLRRLLEDGRKA